MIEKYISGKVAVFIDAANMLYSQQTLKWQIDYKKLIHYLNESSDCSFIGFYYGTVNKNKGQERFFEMLKDRGYSLRTKPVKYIKTKKGTILKGNLDVEIVFDILSLTNTFDSCVLMSGDSDFEIVLKHLRSLKKKVIVISTKGHVSIELIRNCDKYLDLKKLKQYIIRA